MNAFDSLKNAIKTRIMDELAAEIANDMGIQTGKPAARTANAVHATADTEPDTEPAPRKRRRNGRKRGTHAKTRYLPVKAGKAGAAAANALQPAEQTCYRAIWASRPDGITNYQIEQTTGLGRKTVESAVYRLRAKHGIVVSMPVAN